MSEHREVLAWPLGGSNSLAGGWERAQSYSMNTLDSKEAGEELDRILDEAAQTHQPVSITSLRANAVLAPEEDWNAIQETLYLLSVPGMRESIRVGLETPNEECEEEPGW